jgi:hypothetical protein
MFGGEKVGTGPFLLLFCFISNINLVSSSLLSAAFASWSAPPGAEYAWRTLFFRGLSLTGELNRNH